MRDPLDAPAITFGKPAITLEEMHAPCLNPVAQRGAPGSKRGKFITLVSEAVYPIWRRSPTRTWNVEYLADLRRTLQQLDHVRIICGQQNIGLIPEPVRNPNQRCDAQDVTDA